MQVAPRSPTSQRSTVQYPFGMMSPANLQLIESLVRDHAAKSDLIIFPETITTGFSSEAAKLLTESKAKSTKPSSDSLTSTMSLLLGAI